MPFARFFVFVSILVSLIGCIKEPDPIAPITVRLDSDAERTLRDSVLVVLTGADRRELDAAFGKLAAFVYERKAEVRQMDATGAVVARRSWVDRFEGEESARRQTVVSADSAGRFAKGLFGRFAGRAVPNESETELAPFILPTDPPYLTGRGREAYRFRLLSDSVAHDLTLQRVLIEVDPDEPGRHRLRRIQIDIEPVSRAIVGARVLFDHHSLLYRERSLFDFRLQPVGATWLPEHLEMESRIGSTVFDDRHFFVRIGWPSLQAVP